MTSRIFCQNLNKNLIIFKLMVRIWIGILCFIQGILLIGQNTIGVTTIDNEQVDDGYYLVYPVSQSDVFLLNKCGEIVHRWEGEPGSFPGVNAYIDQDGNLYKGNIFSGPDGSFGAGGAGGQVGIYDWDNNFIYERFISDNKFRQHHDIEILPNGNFLCIVWEKYLEDEIRAKGFDRMDLGITELLCDAVYEIDPILDSVVWKWQSWNHLIQDHDPTLPNYSEISQSPGKININYHEYNLGVSDWMHFNSLDYNEELDQIMISCRNFNEIWIIDHSVSTTEAASNTGGVLDQGGQLLYRWGNPAAYNKGTTEDRKLFAQHDAHWVNDFVEPDNFHFGEIACFNNLLPGNFSAGQIFKIEWSQDDGYAKDGEARFLPKDISTSYSHPIPALNNSQRASSIQILNNGNILMCASFQGRSFEIDSEGNLVWEYITPMSSGNPVEQGTSTSGLQNFTFQIKKYPADYPAFQNRDLTPKGFIELMPKPLCTLTSIQNIDEPSFSVKPNPVIGKHFTIQTEDLSIRQLNLVDPSGHVIESFEISSPLQKLELNKPYSGLYYLLDVKNNQAIPIAIMN